MTDEEVFNAMAEGKDRFQTGSGRIYRLDPAQRDVLKPFGTGAVLIGFPEIKNPRKRGRKWSWLKPKNLTLVEAGSRDTVLARLKEL